MSEKFCSYLLGAEDDIYTDIRGLTFWKKAKFGASEQRWMTEMSIFKSPGIATWLLKA